jgi:hypothetical protein
MPSFRSLHDPLADIIAARRGEEARGGGVERGDRALRGGAGDRAHRRGEVGGGFDFRQRQGVGAPAARHDVLESELQHCPVARQRALDQGVGERLGLAVQQRLGELRRGVARPHRPPGRIARHTLGKRPPWPASSLFQQLICSHRSSLRLWLAPPMTRRKSQQ